MSAIPVFIPQVVSSPAPRSEIRRAATTSRATPVPATAAPAKCQLTDRGIAVVIAVAAIIMMVAIAVIGLTVVRVTGTGYASAVPGAPRTHQ